MKSKLEGYGSGWKVQLYKAVRTGEEREWLVWLIRICNWYKPLEKGRFFWPCLIFVTENIPRYKDAFVRWIASTMHNNPFNNKNRCLLLGFLASDIITSKLDNPFTLFSSWAFVYHSEGTLYDLRWWYKWRGTFLGSGSERHKEEMGGRQFECQVGAVL